MLRVRTIDDNFYISKMLLGNTCAFIYHHHLSLAIWSVLVPHKAVRF